MSVLYLDHFELKADPFRITPDTAFFFAGGGRGDILEGLKVAALHDDGIMCVIGEVGMGKTMLSRMLMERLQTFAVDTVYLPNPVFDRDEILDAISRDLHAVSLSGNRAERVAALEKVLIQRHADGRQVVMVIDEAHSMPAGTLEEIRLLSNLETAHSKLLKIILFGQPELGVLLEAPGLRQVKDRISYRFELQPLTADEVSAYLDFRLRKAGYAGVRLFAPDGVRLLAQASGGRTRRLNMLADKALLAAFASGSESVDAGHARRACAEERAGSGTPARERAQGGSRRSWQPAVATGAVLAFGAIAGFAAARWSAPQVLATPSAAIASGPVVSAAVTDAAPDPAPAMPPAAAAEPAAHSDPPATAEPAAIPAPADAVVATAAAAPAASAADEPAAPAAAAPATASTLPPTLEQRIAASEKALISSGGAGYTLQLLALRAPNPAAVESALHQYEKLLGPDAVLWVNERTYGGTPHHAVYTGHYPTRQHAVAALDALPPPLRAQRPFVRSLAKVIAEARP